MKRPSLTVFTIADSIVPIMICLVVEKGLAADILMESAGMIVHVVNIVVLVLIPMVVIHVKGQTFSLGKF